MSKDALSSFLRFVEYLKSLPMQTKVLLILVSIVFFGGMLRLSDFETLVRFNADQVRDAKVVDAMVIGTDLPLLGPKAGGTTFNLGPAYYYLLFLSGSIFGQSPEGIATIVPLLSIASIILLFIFLRMTFSPRLALGLTLLYATSFYVIKYSRFAWNPNLVPFFMLAFLVLLLVSARTNKKNSVFFSVLLGLVIGIGTQLHTILMVLMPLLFVFDQLYLYLRDKQLAVRKLAIVFGIVFISYIPVFVFEWQNNGENTRSFLQGTETKTEQTGSLQESLLLESELFVKGTAYVLTGAEPQKNWLSIKKIVATRNLSEYLLLLCGVSVFGAGIFFLLSRLRKEKDSARKHLFFLVFSTLSIVMLLFFIIAHELNIRFFILLIFLPYLFLGLMIEELAHLLPRPVYTVSVVLLFSLLIGLNLVKYKRAYDFSSAKPVPSSIYGGISTGEARKMADIIEKVHLTSPLKTPVTLLPFEFSRSLRYFTEKKGLTLSSDTLPPIGTLAFLIVETGKEESAFEKYHTHFVIEQRDRVGRFTVLTLLRTSRPDEEACRIGLITDIHASYSKSSPAFIRNESALPLRAFTKHMNEVFRPDVVLELGDFIDGSEDNNERAMETYKATEKLFTDVDVPTLHVMGNHEVRGGGITERQWLDFAKQDRTYYAYSCKDTDIIVLDGNNAEIRKQTGKQFEGVYFVDDAQMKWLSQTLEKSTAKKKLVFIHEPLSKRNELQSLSRVSGDKDLRSEDVEKLQALFKKYNVEAVFSGHVEVLEYQMMDNTASYILPGIHKSKNLAVKWLQSFYEITVPSEKPLSVRMYYKRDVATPYQSVFIPSEEYKKLTR